MGHKEGGVKCKVHGSVDPAFICTHLYSDPAQFWFSELASVENKCPDAWCQDCEKKFQKLGGWPDDNSELANIKLICQNCYDDARAQSVPHCMAEVADSWEPFVAKCVARLNRKQDKLHSQFKINEHQHWAWNQDHGSLIFSNDNVPAVSGRIQFVGSVSTLSDTWLWAWANSSLEPKLSKELINVQKWGEMRKYVSLTVPLWAANAVDGWEMTAVAVELLGAKGAYRTPCQDGFTYLAITDMAWVS